VTAELTVAPSYQEEITGRFFGGRQGGQLLTPTSGFGAGPAREVLVHFPMETILLGVKGGEPCLSD
jgi:hypothetical protein